MERARRVAIPCRPSLIAHLSLPESSMGQTVESVADAVSRNYQAFRLIPDLSITFTLTYEHLGGDRNFIFDRAVIETSRKGEMRRLHLDGDLHNGLQMSRSYAWDGSVATGLHPLDETSGDYFIRQAPDNNLFY